MFTKYYGEYEIGETWVSKGRTVTETDIVMFSALSGDWYPLHTDIEYAKNTPFQQRIAHGMLVLSISTGLLNMESGIVAAFYGIDELRFVKPTFIQDTIKVKLEIVDMREKAQAGVIKAKQTIMNQHEKAVVESFVSVLINKQF